MEDDNVLEAIGSIEECNCFIGAALSQFSLEEELDPIKKELIDIQKNLIEISSLIGAPHPFSEKNIRHLEEWQKGMEAKMTSLCQTIVPGGDPGSAMLFVARSVCKRAERRLLPLLSKNKISTNTAGYIRTLSEYLLVAARFVNHVTHCVNS